MLVEIVGFSATAPGATLTAATAFAGNSLQIRDFKKGRARIIDAGLKSQSATGGTLRLRSTKTENIQGFRADVLQNSPLPLMPYGQAQPAYANDNITAEIAGSATASDLEIGYFQVAYDSYADFNKPFGFAELQALRRANPSLIVETMQITLSLGTGGGYTGEAALSTATQALFNNTNYALLGYTCSATCGFIRLRSNTDFGPLGFGGPGTTRADITKDYFVNLSLQYGVSIPTFNTINLSQILIDGAQDENGTDVTVTLYVVNLQQPQG